MKINPINNPNIIKAYQASRPAASGRSASGSRLDEVTFSKEGLSFAKTLAEARNTSGELNSVKRQEKLEEIAEKVKRGEYNVDSAEVADRMISGILERCRG